MIKVIILIIFCLIAFYYGCQSKVGIDDPIDIECEGGICPPPEEYKNKEGD